MKSFRAQLIRPADAGSWTHVAAPFDVEREFGTRGRVAVRGAIDGEAFRSSLMPRALEGHILVVNTALRQKIGKDAGAMVAVELKRDAEPRTVSLPSELSEALKAHAKAAAMFAALSYSRRNDDARWIDEAKKPSTRQSRALQAIDMISAGRRLKS